MARILQMPQAPPDYWVDAEECRCYLTWLDQQTDTNMRMVGLLLQIHPHRLYDIKAGKQRKIRASLEKRILAVESMNRREYLALPGYLTY